MDRKPDILIRRGRKEDEPYIREFTKNTFDWGDYVGEVFAEWLDEMDDVWVAEVDGIPSAVTCVAYPAQGEAWFQGIRVHSDCRRMGIAHRLTEASIEGARERGAHLCRASIDSENEKSTGLAKSFGFRRVARILEFQKRLGEADFVASTPAQPGSLTVVTVSPEEAASVLNEASKEIRYLGADYVWVGLNLANLTRVASEGTLLAARDQTGRTLAGAVQCEIFEADAEHDLKDGEPPRLDSGLGSMFGSLEGLEALIKHASTLVAAEAVKRSILPGRLYLSVEAGTPAYDKVRSLTGAEPTGEIGLWELPLRRK